MLEKSALLNKKLLINILIRNYAAIAPVPSSSVEIASPVEQNPKKVCRFIFVYK
jgi:hypothetical protein